MATASASPRVMDWYFMIIEGDFRVDSMRENANHASTCMYKKSSAFLYIFLVRKCKYPFYAIATVNSSTAAAKNLGADASQNGKSLSE